MNGDFGGETDNPASFDGTVAGSTGKNDSSSVWGSGLLAGLGSITNSASGLVAALKGPQKPKTNNNTVIYLAIGAVVLLVLGLVVARR